MSSHQQVKADGPEIVVEDAFLFVNNRFEEVKIANGVFFHSAEPNCMTLLRLDMSANSHPIQKNADVFWMAIPRTEMFLRANRVVPQEYQVADRTNHFTGMAGGVCAFIRNAKDFSIPRQELYLELMKRINALHEEMKRRTA